MVLRLTRFVKFLLIFLSVFFLLFQTLDKFFSFSLIPYLAFVPSRVFEGFIWQFFTYSFLLADIFHLVFNGLVIAFLGPEIEASLGLKRFILFFFFCVFFGALSHLLVLLVFSGSFDVPLIGVSAGVYGVLLAYGIFYSERMMLFMMVFPVKSKWFVLMLGAFEFFSSIFSRGSAISNVAHLGGMIGGYLMLLWFTYQNRKPPKKKSNLKLVVNNS